MITIRLNKLRVKLGEKVFFVGEEQSKLSFAESLPTARDFFRIEKDIGCGSCNVGIKRSFFS
jgi:hypothetical protein